MSTVVVAQKNSFRYFYFDIENIRIVNAVFLQDVDVTDNPLFLTYKLGNGSELIANYIVHGKAEVTTFEIYQESDIWSEFLTIRLQANLPFTCNFQTDLFQDASSTLRKQVNIF